MKNKKRSKSKIIWLFVLILFICVAITTLAFTDIIDIFLPNDKGAVSLITENTSKPQATASDNQEAQDTSSSSNYDSQSTESVANPSIRVEDDKAVWNTDTKIELFKASYENGEQIITVKSNGGDKVIAPGTENSYTFKLKNTGDVALDYTLEIDAYCTPEDAEIPITGRICRYDGKWVAGNKEAYSNIATLNQASDTATVGSGKFTYYTLDWKWPFEGGDDTLDTALGNMAKEQDISFTIVIKTTATESANPNADSGIESPKTGDSSNPTLWFTLAIISFVTLIILLFAKKEHRAKAEAENP